MTEPTSLNEVQNVILNALQVMDILQMGISRTAIQAYQVTIYL